MKNQTEASPLAEWENEGGNVPPRPLPAGIVRIVTETYKVGPYRYTNLPDALAQLKRTSPASSDGTEHSSWESVLAAPQPVAA